MALSVSLCKFSVYVIALATVCRGQGPASSIQQTGPAKAQANSGNAGNVDIMKAFSSMAGNGGGGNGGIDLGAIMSMLGGSGAAGSGGAGKGGLDLAKIMSSMTGKNAGASGPDLSSLMGGGGLGGIMNMMQGMDPNTRNQMMQGAMSMFSGAGAGTGNQGNLDLSQIMKALQGMGGSQKFGSGSGHRGSRNGMMSAVMQMVTSMMGQNMNPQMGAMLKILANGMASRQLKAGGAKKPDL
ncbi:hypothetical protein HDE_00219 [Halotydeus destructor]|nr:hypothetical protein HDE_00219 [Halotydeus destructor]